MIYLFKIIDNMRCKDIISTWVTRTQHINPPVILDLYDADCYVPTYYLLYKM